MRRRSRSPSPPSSSPPPRPSWVEWLRSWLWHLLASCLGLPAFARCDPGRVSFCVKAFGPLVAWSDIVREWRAGVTVVRNVAGTSVEGATESLRAAYNDPDVYVQCGLKDVLHPSDSPVWAGLSSVDRRSVLSVMRWGHLIYGRFARVASFITPRGAPKQTTRTHYDEYNGFLCVVQGTKTVYVAPPSACSHAGQLRPNETPQTPFDTRGFAQYSMAAGDVLYIPKGFWHYVETEAETVMITFWFF